MNPYDKAHELARALRSSDVFARMKSARERIEQDDSTLRMIQDFRSRQWELEAKQLGGQQVSQTDVENIRKLSEVVNLNKDVRTYLEAEYQLSILLSDIQKILSEAVHDAMLPAPFQAKPEEESR